MAKSSNPELRKEWERRIAVYRSSGQTQANWCKANEISINQLKYWMRKIEGSKPKSKVSTQWAPVTLEESEDYQDEFIQIKVGAASIEVKPGFNPFLLAEVIKVLKTQC